MVSRYREIIPSLPDDVGTAVGRYLDDIKESDQESVKLSKLAEVTFMLSEMADDCGDPIKDALTEYATCTGVPLQRWLAWAPQSHPVPSESQ